MNPAYSTMTPTEGSHQPLYEDALVHSGAAHVAAAQPPPMFTIPYTHYALLYLDNDGKPSIETSPSIAGSENDIFTQDVRGRFLRSVTGGSSALPGYHSTDSLVQGQDGSLLPSSSLAMYHQSRTRRADMIPCEWQSQRSKRQKRRESETASSSPCPPIRRTALRVGDHNLLRRYYEKAFDNFQQLNCRMIAKAWIKLVEPRKQVNHPYNGRKNVGGSSHKVDPELTKPRWWPVGVTHKEPDHLPKPERVRLLIHILCELRSSHDITAEKLREAGQDVRRQISPVERLEVLDEIYYVRQMEEHCLNGDIGADTTLHVSHVHLPEASLEFDHDFPQADHPDAVSSIPNSLPRVAAIRGSDDGSSEYCLPLTPSSSCPSNGPRSPAQTHNSYSPDIASSMMSSNPHAHAAAYVTSKDDPHHNAAAAATCIPDYFGQPFLVPPTSQGYWAHPPQPQAAPAYPGGY